MFQAGGVATADTHLILQLPVIRGSYTSAGRRRLDLSNDVFNGNGQELASFAVQAPAHHALAFPGLVKVVECQPSSPGVLASVGSAMKS